MAIGTTAAILGGTSIVQGGIQAISGGKQKRDAKKALDNLVVPELENAFEDIKISTIGSDLIREEGQRTTANLIDASQSGGVRSIMSNIPKIVGLNNTINKEARNYLDNQVNKRQYAIAQDNTRIRGMEEQRYQGEVQGLGQAMMVGNQNMWSGIRGIGSGISYLGRNLENGGDASLTEDELAVINANY